MAWYFSALSTPLASPTPGTQLIYGDANAQTRINGTGFTYDAVTGLLNGGSITSLEYWNMTANGGAGALHQTVTPATAITGADFFAFFGAANTIQNVVIDGWGFSLGLLPLFTDTLITMPGADGSRLLISGTGLGSDFNAAATGTVTSIQHVDANGVQIGGHLLTGLSVLNSIVMTSINWGAESFNFLASGNDVVTAVAGQFGFPRLDGGPGNDTIDGSALESAAVDYASAPAGVSIDLAAGTASGGGGNDVLIGLNKAFGSAFADSINGNANANEIDGLTGDDLINGLGSADRLDGGWGNDTIDGGLGNDTLYGSAGGDRLTGGGGIDSINTNEGADIVVYTRDAGTVTVTDFGLRYFTASQTGANEVPGVVTTASGFAQLQYRDFAQVTATFSANGIDLDGSQTPSADDNLAGIAFHLGTPGISGPVIYDLQADPDTALTPFPSGTGFFGSTIWTGQFDMFAELAAGNLYMNIRTTGNPAGEIRGQIVESAGGYADRIDVSALGISSFTDLQLLFATSPGPFAPGRLTSSYNGELSVLEITNYTAQNFTVADFIFGGFGNEEVTGTANVDDLFGGDGADVLNGLGGNDRLVGGAGTDAMSGDTGDDLYYVDTYLDAVLENPGSGNDTVISSDSYIFHPNVENVTLTGSDNLGVIGNELANAIWGNIGNNGITGGDGGDTIEGAAGNDTIDGGTGADHMAGSSGIDVYFVDSASDVVTEFDEAGAFDTIWANVGYVLPTGVEILILDGVENHNGTGNAGHGGNAPNLMLGNPGNNTITTFGGDDIILGGAGNDVINSGAGSAAGVEIIAGGVGSDTLTSSGGHDFFTYTAISEAGDVITDFGQAGDDLDILDLRPLFPTFTNTTGITTVAGLVASGHLTYTQAGANTQVFADADGGANNNVLLATLNDTTAATVQLLTLI